MYLDIVTGANNYCKDGKCYMKINGTQYDIARIEFDFYYDARFAGSSASFYMDIEVGTDRGYYSIMASNTTGVPLQVGPCTTPRTSARR